MFTSQYQVVKFVEAEVEKLTAFAKASNLVIPSWTCKVRVSISAKRTRSWGGTKNGVAFISVAAHQFMKKETSTFYEYSSFAKDPDIGTFTGQTERALAKLVAHEFAHAIQWGSPTLASAATSCAQSGGHGDMWKSLYRMLVRNVWAVSDYPTTHENKVMVKQQNVISRSQALAEIAKWLVSGLTKRECINKLVEEFGYKKTTATTYVYSV